MYKKVFLVCLAALLAAPLFSAGGREGSAPSPSAYPTGKITYPLKTDETLTYWVSVTPDLSPNFGNVGDVPFYQGWIERTGVNVTFLHPPLGADNEQFNLMVSSGDMPDIVAWDMINRYPGGPEKAINDGTILKLNDILDKYAPNLKDVLTKNPDYDRLVKTDSSSYFTFPNIRSDVGLCIWQGLQIRKDWLDELGLQAPVTYDDWHNVLTAFKTRKNSPAPLTIYSNASAFMFGYGFDRDFYVGDDGKVLWGRVQPAYRDYLAMMSQWYKEGLLDPDTASLTSQQIAARITTGTSGATHASLNSGMGTYLPSGRATDPKFTLMGVKNPVKNRNDKLAIITIDMPFSGGNGSVSISGNTEHPEIAARFLDWAYGEEGYMYHNFGTPGVSYNMVNGYPTYTELALKNPKGWPIGQSLAVHIMASYAGPHIQSMEYFDQVLVYPEQREALKNWTIEEPFRHRLPGLTPTPEESQELARIMAEINAYADEMMVKYILGTEPLGGFDAYVNTIKTMGIDRALEIQNAAFTRYNNR